MAAQPAVAKPRPGALGLYVQDAGASREMTVCGASHPAYAVERGTRPFLASSANRRAKVARTARLQVQRCEDGRWTDLGPAKLRKRVDVPTERDADLRYTARGATQYVRVGEGPVTVVPLSFRVQNVNRTQVACPVDGKSYTVRGHITAPAASLEPGGEDHVTLFNHGHGFSEELWRYQAVPGYDVVGTLAGKGHTSVTYDRLGYEASDKPPGHASCYASEADVTHQIIQKLRSGDYTTEGMAAPKFPKVALAGHSQASIINELVMGQFPEGRPDALLHFSFVSAFLSPSLAVNYEQNVEDCVVNPTRHANDDPKAPDGYAPRGRTAEAFQATNFYDADPAVVADWTAKRNVDPCGFPETVLDAVAKNQLTDATVGNTPILLTMGDHDPNFNQPPLALEYQDALYAGGEHVDTEVIQGGGHANMLEKVAPQFIAVIDGFLNRNGF